MHEYKKFHFCKAKNVDLIISKYQLRLCASIDRVVIENKCILSNLVKIKCPISCSKQAVINYNRKSYNEQLLEFGNGALELKKPK